ncbi:hypothetical protein [Nisaea sediminum]|uniref:hypothetical protein n=1 Tax=Nisaea sediminum TaxID=2775867 RepID=UPI001868551B|nr:hypothetical protein [Nisaea sediminum]
MTAFIPTAEGWYFAKWRVATDGTRDGDELTPSDSIDCVQVVLNTVDPTSRDRFRAFVVGVERSQSLDGFVWIGPVPMPGGGQ